ncbi:MAG: NAD-dependent epimerase/dehydratase family protein [Lachnospiraceae bacterium]|nr:NAD-dependent epimerase/dehydratase family protein [Lachnospiraceae bacterium]
MRFLIIGASGFLGETIYKKLKDRNQEVKGTYSSNKRTDEYIYLDVLNTDNLLGLYETYQPDVVIWTVMNAELEEEIAERSIYPLINKMRKTRFIFLSTSVACEENMGEDVTPVIRNSDMYHYHYFNGKIKSENYIKDYDNFVIVRPGSIYGKNPFGIYDKRTQLLKKYIDNKEIYVRAANIVFSIVEVNDLADCIIELSEGNYVGIINISEEIPISHYDFNIALCNRYGFDSEYVIPNIEKENIYYFDNSLRKRILRTKIGSLER